MRRLEIEIKPDGTVEIEAMGFVGPACDQATRLIEEALGIRTTERKKREFYQQAQQQGQKATQGG